MKKKERVELFQVFEQKPPSLVDVVGEGAPVDRPHLPVDVVLPHAPPRRQVELRHGPRRDGKLGVVGGEGRVEEVAVQQRVVRNYPLCNCLFI